MDLFDRFIEKQALRKVRNDLPEDHALNIRARSEKKTLDTRLTSMRQNVDASIASGPKPRLVGSKMVGEVVDPSVNIGPGASSPVNVPPLTVKDRLRSLGSRAGKFIDGVKNRFTNYESKVDKAAPVTMDNVRAARSPMSTPVQSTTPATNPVMSSTPVETTPVTAPVGGGTTPPTSGGTPHPGAGLGAGENAGKGFANTRAVKGLWNKTPALGKAGIIGVGATAALGIGSLLFGNRNNNQ